MELPNAHAALVGRRKVVEYLLSPVHPDGKHKARFFRACGYCVAAWERLANDLLMHARTKPVVKTTVTPYGIRYNVEGEFRTPKEGVAVLRSIWFIDTGEQFPRLVTAYPLKRNR